MTAHSITSAVAAFYGVPLADMQARTKVQHIALARHVAMYLLYTHAEMSKTAIGELFQRDRTSVLHAIKRISRMNGETRQQIEYLEKEVKASETKIDS